MPFHNAASGMNSPHAGIGTVPGIEAEVRNSCSPIRLYIPVGKPVTVLHIGAEQAWIATGSGSERAAMLELADVGIAMGTGTDVAMESAGVTLVKGDLRGIARAAVLSRATMRNIRQNLAFASGYNALGIPVAAGVLYPAFGLLLSPIFAGAAMAMSSVSVVTNALRLNRVKL